MELFSIKIRCTFQLVSTQQTASSPVVTARRMLLTLNDRVIEE